MKIRNFDIQDMELDGVTGDVQNGIEIGKNVAKVSMQIGAI